MVVAVVVVVVSSTTTITTTTIYSEVAPRCALEVPLDLLGIPRISGHRGQDLLGFPRFLYDFW